MLPAARLSCARTSGSYSIRALCRACARGIRFYNISKIITATTTTTTTKTMISWWYWCDDDGPGFLYVAHDTATATTARRGTRESRSKRVCWRLCSSAIVFDFFSSSYFSHHIVIIVFERTRQTRVYILLRVRVARVRGTSHVCGELLIGDGSRGPTKSRVIHIFGTLVGRRCPFDFCSEHSTKLTYASIIVWNIERYVSHDDDTTIKATDFDVS